MLKVEISVTLVDQGIPASLKFGWKSDLDSITISAMNNSCSKEFESAKYVDIRHGQIFESECTKFTALVLSSYQELTTNQITNQITIEQFYKQQPRKNTHDTMHNVSMLISKYGESRFLSHKVKLYEFSKIKLSSNILMRSFRRFGTFRKPPRIMYCLLLPFRT